MGRSIREQIARKCVHFNGIQNKQCEAGIRYEDVRGTERPYKFPCLNDGGSCPKCRFMTEEEAEAEEKRMKEASSKALLAYAAVKGHVDSTKAQQGTVDCICGGQLRYVVSATNGHIWAKCDSCGIGFNE